MFILRRIIKILLRIVISFAALSVGLALLYRFVAVPFTPLMVIRCAEQWSAGDKLTMKHDWVSLEEISPHLQLAAVCSEDQNFLTHGGFDWNAIEKAIEYNESGRRIRGGSTITQQTVKNVFLWPGRSYLRKGLEAWFTVLAELLWSKERILTIYLNSIEMGPGIYGAEAAAQHWFRKPAKKLTADEAVAITAILPNPRKYSANPPGPYIARRKQWVKKQMRLWGGRLEFDQETKADGSRNAVNDKKKK